MELNIEGGKTNLDFALAYARKGWPVFPLHSIRNGQCSCGNHKCVDTGRAGKHPRTEHGFHDATSDQNKIIQWWSEVPDANIGVKTGKDAGISVLDVDLNKGGYVSLDEFNVPETLYSKTGGGGQHKIYQYDARIPTTTSFRPGIDFRSDGGYIVVPPSNHLSGNNYVWCDESLEPAPAPEWMKSKGLLKLAGPLPTILEDGSRNALLTSLAGSMRRRGASQQAIEKALMEENKRCSPPLGEDEVIGIAKSISRYEPAQVNQIKDDSVLLTSNQIEQIKHKIRTLPREVDKTEISPLIHPIIKEIAQIDIPQGDAILRYTIKEHFNLTNDDIDSYEKILKGYRKENKDEENLKPLNQSELIQKFRETQGTHIIHPAQDYVKGLMFFAVKAQGLTCLVTTDRRLFTLKEATSYGFRLKQNSVDTARFSAKAVTSFVNGDYQVNSFALYQKIKNYINRFVVFPDSLYLDYIVLWIMGTYLFMIFRYYPYVWLHAEKQSGKTLLLEIKSTIAFNGGALITNPTESVIFRDISNNLPTLFIDEVERLRKADKDGYGMMVSILNSGFSKSGTVKRVEGNGQSGFSVKEYNTYSPKVFAGINEIDDVLQDRTVRIPLLRKKDGEIVERYKETPEVLELQQSIRDDLYVFALTNAKIIAELYHKGEVKGLSHLSNRELDIWEPIVLLANLVDGQSDSTNLTSGMRRLSELSIDEKQQENVLQNETYKTLAVFKSMIDEGEVGSYPASGDHDWQVFQQQEVFDYFKKSEQFEWLEKTNSLTRKLRNIKIISEQRRYGGSKKRVYVMSRKQFADLCERYKIR